MTAVIVIGAMSCVALLLGILACHRASLALDLLRILAGRIEELRRSRRDLAEAGSDMESMIDILDRRGARHIGGSEGISGEDWVP